MVGHVMRPLQSQIECMPSALGPRKICWSPCGQFLVMESHKDKSTWLQILKSSSLACIHSSVHPETWEPSKPSLNCENQGIWSVLPTASSRPAPRIAVFPRLDLLMRLDMVKGTWHAARLNSHAMLSHSSATAAPDGSCIVVSSEADNGLYQVDLPSVAVHQINQMGSMPANVFPCSFAHFPGGWSAVYACCQRVSGRKELHRGRAVAEPQLAEGKDIVLVDAKADRVTGAWTYRELVERAGVSSEGLLSLCGHPVATSWQLCAMIVYCC